MGRESLGLGDHLQTHQTMNYAIGYVIRDNGVKGPGYREWREPVYGLPESDKTTKQMGAVTISRNGYVQELESENARMRKALGKADAILNGWGLGTKSPLRLEIADILSNAEISNPHPERTPQ